jgi:hypothetical protein
MDWAGIEPAASPMPRARNTTLPPAQRSGKIFFHDGMKQGRFGLHHARKAIYPGLSARSITMGCHQLKELFHGLGYSSLLSSQSLPSRCGTQETSHTALWWSCPSLHSGDPHPHPAISKEPRNRFLASWRSLHAVTTPFVRYRVRSGFA